MMSHIEVEDRFTSGVYGKRNVCFVRGAGATLWDADGRDYIDCAAGISVANLGHAHPHLVEAIGRQAATLMTAPELAYNDQRARLLERLAQVTPQGVDRFFLCNSGAEAVEGALKFARLATGRTEIVALNKGFHGRTFGALSATHKQMYRAPFAPLVPDFRHIRPNDPTALDAITERTAAVVIELIQGEGGIRPLEPTWVDRLRRITADSGTLLIVDEIQTGFGRTGTLWACDQYALQPDIMTLGKAMAGGVPMGAVGLSRTVGDLPRGSHGSTFGGNPLACAAALATLDIIEQEGLVARSAAMGDYFRRELAQRNLPLIRQVRGSGLMLGLDLRVRVGVVVQALMARGIVVLNAGPTVLRLLPPLTISRQQLDAVLDALELVLTELAQPAAVDA